MININKIEKYTFLIQSDSREAGTPLYDFGFDIKRAIQDESTFRATDVYSYIYTDFTDLSKFKLLSEEKNILYIPIGSVEFVENFLIDNQIKLPKPYNIPKHLRKLPYCKRIIQDITSVMFNNNRGEYNDYYIKSADRYKQIEITIGKYYDFFHKNKKIENYYINSEIKPKIINEFRCFVFNNTIISIRPYINDLTYEISKRHVGILNEIIEQNINNIDSTYYTIDYGILKDDSFELIELQHPYSVGNYGFNGIELLLFYLRGFLEIIK